MASSSSLLDWRSGGWLLLASALLVVVVVVWNVVPVLRSERRAVGGQRVADYGFDLSSIVVPPEKLTPSGVLRGGIPALEDPATMRGSEVAPFNEAHRGKYLVSADRVIGVVINGEARAYPIRVLNWHEVANDTLGGVPIAVTFSPLCDSAVVFDRRVETETLRFGVSGLLLDSNLVLYDVQSDDGASSLWSQLQARAVAGPAAGLRLEVLPASLVRWGSWLERFPETTVLRPGDERLKRYQRNPYGSYLARGEPRFPVEPMPPEGSLPPMTPVLIVGGEGAVAVYRLDREPGADLVRAARQAGIALEQDAPEPPLSALVLSGRRPRTFYSRWFAWYAQYPDHSPFHSRSIVPDSLSGTR